MENHFDRRTFLLGTVGAAAAGLSRPDVVLAADRSPAQALPRRLRADFPQVTTSTFFNSASQHPLSRQAAAAITRYLAFRTDGPGERRSSFGRSQQLELKRRLAGLFNATGDEIAFVQSTSDGENIVVSGLDLARRGGNVVVDDLHFTSSLYMYKALEATGLELRVVPQRDGAVDLNDVDRAIDRETRLVSMALVSNVNGYLHDVAAISRLAHDRGAYLYADVIQAVGAVPMDMRAMGIDFAAASTYKWLMAERGFGFLYVRRELQGDVLPTTRWGHRQLNRFDRFNITWEPLEGAARYETGNIAEALAACLDESVKYIESIGIARIAAHAARLTTRLHRELPPLGYRSLTPEGNPTPVVSFEVPDAGVTRQRLIEGNVVATLVDAERRLRLSVSVFNTDDDIDRLRDVLGPAR